MLKAFPKGTISDLSPLLLQCSHHGKSKMGANEPSPCGNFRPAGNLVHDWKELENDIVEILNSVSRQSE
jgi:hypothetical protein